MQCSSGHFVLQAHHAGCTGVAVTTITSPPAPTCAYCYSCSTKAGVSGLCKLSCAVQVPAYICALNGSVILHATTAAQCNGCACHVAAAAVSLHLICSRFQTKCQTEAQMTHNISLLTFTTMELFLSGLKVLSSTQLSPLLCHFELTALLPHLSFCSTACLVLLNHYQPHSCISC